MLSNHIKRIVSTFEALTLRPLHTSSIVYSPDESSQILTQGMQLAGTGNPYETKIPRRRQVENISMPNFEKIECLKWANWMMLRDVKRRHLNAKYWQYRLNMHSLAYCRTLPSVIRDIALEERNSTPRDASVNHLNNRCSLTSRGRGKFWRYRLSRIVWRDLADHGLLSGPIRAKWG